MMKKRAFYQIGAALLTLSLALCGCGKDAALSPQDDPNEGLGAGTISDWDTTDLAGIYLPVDETSEWSYLDIHDDSTFALYGINADITGWLGYDEDYDAVYAYEDGDDGGALFYVDDDGSLYFASYGYFYDGGMESMWYDDGGGDHDGGGLNGGDEYYSYNAELYQRDISEFEGVWYYDGDLSATTYINIDAYGNWSYYQRAPGTEAAEMDCGYLTYSADETSTYYAESTMYDGVSIRVFEFDADVLIWGDEGAYYLME